MVTPLLFRTALLTDYADIAALVNSAYRGDTSRQGWTTEADLLDGLRTSVNDVRHLVESEAQSKPKSKPESRPSVILVCISGDDLIASVCLEKEANTAHIGMFVVNPAMQGLGIGKQLLTYAESYAVQHWAVNKFCMHVITIRHELIAFYERRGYRRTGIVKTFPVNPQMWQPKMTNLQLELLEKTA